MKRNIIITSISIFSFLIMILAIVLYIHLNNNRNILLKDVKGKTVINLGKYKTVKYDESKKDGYRCSFEIKSYDEFLNFMKNNAFYDSELCFDCTTDYSIVYIDTNTEEIKQTPRTIGYIIKDGYLFCYDINSNYVSFELIVSPYRKDFTDDYKVVNEPPYFVCDWHMYYYGASDDGGFITAPCWRGSISFTNIKKIYEKLDNITVEINEVDKYIIIYTIDEKNYEINKNKKIIMTFDDRSFIKYEIIE